MKVPLWAMVWTATGLEMELETLWVGSRERLMLPTDMNRRDRHLPHCHLVVMNIHLGMLCRKLQDQRNMMILDMLGRMIPTRTLDWGTACKQR